MLETRPVRSGAFEKTMTGLSHIACMLQDNAVPAGKADQQAVSMTHLQNSFLEAAILAFTGI